MVLGKAWSSFPVAAPTTSTCSRSNDEGFGAHAPTPQNPTALLVSELSSLLRDLPRGSVVVAASDVLLGLPGGVSLDFSASSLPSDGVIGLAVPAPLHTAKNHGVFVLESYSEHVQDDDRLDLSGDRHDGGARNDVGGGDRDIEDGDGAASSKRKERQKVLVAEGEGMRLRPMTVTCFLQKPSPEVMKGTHHCTFGGDLSYKDGNDNGNDSSDINNTAQTEQECAWIDTGVVVFLPGAAEQLRALAGGALRCCTHRGLQAMYDKERANDDSGGDGIGGRGTMEEYAKNHTVKVELYTHLMLALSTAGNEAKLAKQDKRRQGRGLQAYVDEHTTSKVSSELLTEIYTRLSKLPFRAAAVPAGRFVHLGTTSELLDFLICGSCLGKLPSTEPRGGTLSTLEVDAGRKSLGQKIGLRSRFNSFALGVEPGDDDNVLLSSVLLSLDPAQAGRIGSGTVVEHSSLRCPHLVVGNNCLVSGIRGTSSASVVIPDGMCLQMMPLSSAWASPGGSEENGDSTAMPGVSSMNYVFVCLAVKDPIKAASTIYGIPVDCLLKLSRLTESDLWDDSIEKDKRMLWNARIHPVLECSSSGDPDDVILSLRPLQWITFLTSSDSIGGKDDGIVLSAEAQASLDLWRSLPRLSLSEVRNLADPEAEFAFRSSVNSAGVAVAKSSHLTTVRHIILGRKHLQTDFRYVVDSFVSATIEGDASEALSCLDDILLTAMKSGDLDIVGRAFMVIGDLLRALGSTFADGIEAQGRPLANEEQWRLCVGALRFSKHSSSNQDKTVEIAKKLVSLRDQALSTTLCRRLLYFLAANYEEAAFALTEVCVLSSAAAISSRRSSGFGTSNKAGSITTNTPLAAGTWAVATAPARVDLQGGWSDTPPISYEHGGAVAGLAIRLDGKRPLSARCRIIASAQPAPTGIKLKSEGRDLITGSSTEVDDACVLSKVSDLADFRSPMSSCALLKCALIYLGLVPLVEVTPENDNDLQPYINKFCQSGTYNVGLEVISTSLLPKGSGLGTSSILGDCVLAAIEKCVGANVTGMGSPNADENIVGAVLTLEQLMTTGGGWQDQVNGLVGGLKVGKSAQSIPLRTSISRVPLDEDTREALDRRIVLAFSGQPRLAKNILVNVLRRWGRRTDEITKTLEELVAGAREAADAAQAADIDKVGECLSKYWQLKKVMAGLDSGVEPRVVADVLSILMEQNAIVGGSLCGAGGGGFLAVITCEGKGLSDILNIVDDSILSVNKDVSLFSWHKATVDENGLVVQVVQDVGGDSTEIDFDLSWHQ